MVVVSQGQAKQCEQNTWKISQNSNVTGGIGDLFGSNSSALGDLCVCFSLYFQEVLEKNRSSDWEMTGFPDRAWETRYSSSCAKLLHLSNSSVFFASVTHRGRLWPTSTLRSRWRRNGFKMLTVDGRSIPWSPPFNARYRFSLISCFFVIYQGCYVGDVESLDCPAVWSVLFKTIVFVTLNVSVVAVACTAYRVAHCRYSGS